MFVKLDIDNLSYICWVNRDTLGDIITIHPCASGKWLRLPSPTRITSFLTSIETLSPNTDWSRDSYGKVVREIQYYFISS